MIGNCIEVCSRTILQDALQKELGPALARIRRMRVIKQETTDQDFRTRIRLLDRRCDYLEHFPISCPTIKRIGNIAPTPKATVRCYNARIDVDLIPQLPGMQVKLEGRLIIALDYSSHEGREVDVMLGLDRSTGCLPENIRRVERGPVRTIAYDNHWIKSSISKTANVLFK